MNFDKIDKILTDEPKFRSKQVRQLIWRDLIASWDEATTLPIELRAKLKAEAPLEIKAEVFEEAYLGGKRKKRYTGLYFGADFT